MGINTHRNINSLERVDYFPFTHLCDSSRVRNTMLYAINQLPVNWFATNETTERETTMDHCFIFTFNLQYNAFSIQSIITVINF